MPLRLEPPVLHYAAAAAAVYSDPRYAATYAAQQLKSAGEPQPPGTASLIPGAPGAVDQQAIDAQMALAAHAAALAPPPPPPGGPPGSLPAAADPAAAAPEAAEEEAAEEEAPAAEGAGLD